MQVKVDKKGKKGTLVVKVCTQTPRGFVVAFCSTQCTRTKR